VIVGSANGCSSLNTTLDTLSTVEVRIQPRPRATAGPDLSICLGDSALLQGFASDAGPDYSYSWTPSFGLSDSSVQAPVGSPELTVTYFLVTFSNGCPSLADSMTLFVRALPTVAVQPSYDVCAGDSVQLDALAEGDLLASSYTYAWTPAAGLSDPSIRNPLASPAASTLYKVQARSDFGCESAAYDVQVNVLPKPIAFAGPDTALCQGDTLALQGSYTVAGGALTQAVGYEWSGPALSSPFVANPMAAPVSSSLYTLRVSSGSCASTDAVLVDVFTQVRASVSADTNRICQGLSVQLNAAGGLGSSSYLWTPAAGLDDPSRPNPIARPDTSTTYTLTLREGICADQQSLRIEVNPAPRPDYFSSLTEGCDPLTVAFAENSGSGISFVWEFGDESPLSNESSPEHTYKAPGLYDVRFTATGPGGCSASAAPRQIRVYPRGTAAFAAEPPMGTRISLPDAAVAFSDLSQGAVSYFWDFGDSSYSQAPSPVHLYQEAGEYAVTLIITDAGGCVDTFSLGPVLVISPDLFIPNVFTPNGDNVNDLFRVRYEGKEGYQIQIFDRWGRKMFEAASASESWDGLGPEGGEAPEGVYFYQIAAGGRNFSGSLTLLR
jgi:gliding motility-associated-like protein